MGVAGKKGQVFFDCLEAWAEDLITYGRFIGTFRALDTCTSYREVRA